MSDLIIHARQAGTAYDSDLLEITNEVQRLNPHIYNRADEGPYYEDETDNASKSKEKDKDTQ